MIRRPPRSARFPYTPLFRPVHGDAGRLALLPDTEHPVDAFGTAVDELMAAALTGGAHPCDAAFGRDVVAVLATRSEEHTSELQYANISYAVFCLKKKLDVDT